MPSFRWSSSARLAVVLVLLGKAQSRRCSTAPAPRFGLDRAGADPTAQRPLVRLRPLDAAIAGTIFSVYQENLQLKEENARLRQWRNVAIVLQERVERYQVAAACRARSQAECRCWPG